LQASLKRIIARCLPWATVLVLTLAGEFVLAAGTREYYATMAKTRWLHPEGKTPISYREWLSSRPEEGAFESTAIVHLEKMAESADAPGFLIVVNSSLYPQIQFSIDQYVADLTAEEYAVETFTTSGGTPEDLRAFLQDRYVEGVVGCVLIGDLPIPWYEADWPDDGTHEEFPCDLFYMDLDGIFADTDTDGLYDSHTGDVSPEIWLGRLTASPLIIGGVNEVSLVQNYFVKNHRYRTGDRPLDQRALVYIDDDWVPWSVEWDQNVGLAYTDRVFYNDEMTTFDEHYESRLPENYEFIQVCVHSYSGGHAFRRPGDIWGWTMSDEVVQIDPVAYFYNLFACSNARYVEYDYMGGWYIFCDNYGLASVGSTKTGSMLEFDEFYGPFGEGLTIGEAFRDWFAALAADGFDEWEISWHYGMTLCGDPTLQSFDCTDFCDLNLDGNLNPLDVSYIVNFVYRQLDARAAIERCPRGNGDWDCSGQVNPVDVAYFVNYVYKSLGDGPCDPCAP